MQRQVTSTYSGRDFMGGDAGDALGSMNRAMSDAEQVGGLLYGDWRRCTN